MIRIIAMLIFCLTSLASAQNWEIQSPWPTTATLQTVCFPSATLGFVGGESGILLRTSDGGINWTQVSPGDNTHWVNSICFTDPVNGWVCGSNSSLQHTTDGGLTWSDVPTGTWFFAQYIYFSSHTNGWMIGFPSLHTTDGGVTWDTLSTLGGSRDCSAAFFTDSLHGWVVAGYSEALLRTTDGGVTWSSFSLDPNQWVEDLWFVNADEGWMTTYETDEGSYYLGRILHTVNGGQTWTIQFADSSTVVLTPAFHDALHGCVAFSRGIVATDDGGQTWQRITTPGRSQMSGVSLAGAEDYVATGAGSLIVRSSDNGATWHQLSRGVAGRTWNAVAISDARHGWVGGRWSDMLRTSDGGNHWWLSDLPLEAGVINDIVALDSLRVLIGAGGQDNDGNIFRSTDGGLTWSAQFAESVSPVTDLFFLNVRLGWAVERDSLYHSTDGGQNWSAQASSDGCAEVFFVDSLTGWACGSPQWIIHTEDGGATWTRQWTEAGYGITDLMFCNRNVGWVRLEGYHGSALNTTDGGAHWNWFHLPGWPELNKLAFADSLNGFIIAMDNTGEWLWRSTDSGNSWIADENTLPVHDGAADMALLNPREGWLVDGQYVLHYTSSLATNPSRGLQPARFAPSAYPNPFNPNTILSFEVPLRNRVTLSVYDLTGRLVQTLADREYAQGSYRINFDGSNLSSGIYFARLQGKSFSTTQKLVLLK